MKLRFKSIRTICAAIMMIAALVVSAAATDDTSIEDQMAANSAAWWIAYENGDQETMDALHAENEALAAELAGEGGEANYNEGTGSWDITTEDGSHISSSGDGQNKGKEISYTTTNPDGTTDYSNSYIFSEEAIGSYMDNGGTNEGLMDSYNSVGNKESTSGIPTEDGANLSAEYEINIAKQVLGLTDEEADDLQNRIEQSKADYEAAHQAYAIAKENGDEEAMAAAKEAMAQAHTDAQDARAEYNYSADSEDYADGGYFYTEDGEPVPYSGFFLTGFRHYFDIVASAGNGGTISPSGTITVRKNGSLTLTITPNTGYRIKSVEVDGIEVGAVSSYTFENVNDNHSILAIFAKDTYTITASAGSGGSISPSGANSVAYGGSQSFTITPGEGYEIQSVMVDGQNVGAVSSYTFDNVQRDHNISAVFVKKTYTIIASAGTGGSISPSGTIQVTHGESRSFSFIPDWGYKVKSVIVDGVDKGAVGGYSFSYINGNHTISVTFEPSGEIGLDDPVVTDDTGLETDGSGIKSGYGIFASVDVTYSGVTDVKLTMTYDFGFGVKTVVLEETGRFVFEYPVNSQSPLGKRCVYIPVETLDGTYTLTFTLTAKNVEGEVLTETSTATVVVRGNMYEDDFTGDS